MSAPAAFTSCPILYQDRCILVVNKPAGVLSHPNLNRADEAVAFPGAYDAGKRCFATPAGPLWLIHRLDEDTSGVLLAAKTEAHAEACRAAFEEDRVRKHYFALVSGTQLRPAGTWLDHLATTAGKNAARTRVIPQARANAELAFKVLVKNPSHRMSLLDIDLMTGKTHQIRVQAATRRCPVLGDDVYGDFALNREVRRAWGLSRLFLHAHRLEIIHPATRKRIVFEAELPGELAAVLEQVGMGLSGIRSGGQ